LAQNCPVPSLTINNTILPINNFDIVSESIQTLLLTGESANLGIWFSIHGRHQLNDETFDYLKAKLADGLRDAKD
jgi:hypothetical protein